jgi:hypothetical protein
MKTLTFLLLCAGPLAAQSPPQWNYLVWQDRSFKIEKQQAQLDSLGRAGWELVGTNSVQVLGATGAMLFYFKRSTP